MLMGEYSLYSMKTVVSTIMMSRGVDLPYQGQYSAFLPSNPRSCDKLVAKAKKRKKSRESSGLFVKVIFEALKFGKVEGAGKTP